MTQYFLNVPTIFPQCTELESASYIVWHILKELCMSMPRKVLVHWTWNYNVFNKYWVSKQGSVPSEDRALMSQLLDQHNKLIENLRKRDDIIQKKFDALDD